jgi:hypothetical protein
MSEAEFVWPDYEMIETPQVLRALLLKLGEAVIAGRLVQHNTEDFDITKYKDGDPWPNDIIICYFSDSVNSYRLAVDTYHGAGGTWEKIA